MCSVHNSAQDGVYALGKALIIYELHLVPVAGASPPVRLTHPFSSLSLSLSLSHTHTHTPLSLSLSFSLSLSLSHSLIHSLTHYSSAQYWLSHHTDPNNLEARKYLCGPFPTEITYGLAATLHILYFYFRLLKTA